MAWFLRIASVLIAAAAVLGASGCGSGSSTTESSTTVAEPPAGPVKAKMVGGSSFASSEVEWPQNNGWEAHTRSQTLVVSVGGLATSARHVGDAHPNLPRAVRKRRNARHYAHPRDGFIEILGDGPVARRHKPVTAVHGTGAITITKAPTGKGLPRSTLNADIEFTSQSGTTGTLHLKDGTVTLNKDPSG